MFSTRAKKVPISHWRHFQAGGKWGKIHPKAVRPPARPFAFDKEIIIFAPNWEKERIRRSPPFAATSPAVQRGESLISAQNLSPKPGHGEEWGMGLAVKRVGLWDRSALAAKGGGGGGTKWADG